MRSGEEEQGSEDRRWREEEEVRPQGDLSAIAEHPDEGYGHEEQREEDAIVPSPDPAARHSRELPDPTIRAAKTSLACSATAWVGVLPCNRLPTLDETFKPRSPIPPNTFEMMARPVAHGGEADVAREDHPEENRQAGQCATPDQDEGSGGTEKEEGRELVAHGRDHEDADQEGEEEPSLTGRCGQGRPLSGPERPAPRLGHGSRGVRARTRRSGVPDR